MLNQFSRTQLLYGKEAMDHMASCRIAVFGIGGVGGYVVEALARSGIGALDLIDDDKVCLTNINRQILATRKTVGKYKVNVAEERIKEINPDCDVRSYKTFYLPETQDQFNFSDSDYVVDAIDTVTGKLEDDVDLQLLRQALKELPERDREIVYMRFGLEGRRELTQKEVAQKMGISQSYISRLEKRIMQRLRKDLLRQTSCA